MAALDREVEAHRLGWHCTILSFRPIHKLAGAYTVASILRFRTGCRFGFQEVSEAEVVSVVEVEVESALVAAVEAANVVVREAEEEIDCRF